MEITRVLNIDALCITEQELLKGLDRNLDSTDAGNGVLVTPNLDHMVKLQKDEEFYHCYQEAQWVVCDSKILWLCSKVLKRSFPEPIPGSSFFTHFYEYRAALDPNGSNGSTRIFLLGAGPGVAKDAMDKINAKVGGCSETGEVYYAL